MISLYSIAGFTFPCSRIVAEKAVKALSNINQQYTDFADLALFKSDSESMDLQERIIRHCFYSHPNQKADWSNKELAWNFDLEIVPDGLCFSTPLNGNFDVEHAAVFIQALMIALNLNDDFVFVASTGEKTNLHVVINKMQICRSQKSLVME